MPVVDWWGVAMGGCAGLFLLFARWRPSRNTLMEFLGRVGIGLGLSLGFTAQVAAWLPSVNVVAISAALMGFGTEVLPIVLDALRTLRGEVVKIIKAKAKAIHKQETGPAPLDETPAGNKVQDAIIQRAIQAQINKANNGQSTSNPDA